MKGHLRSQFTQQRTQSKKLSAPFSIILFTLFAFLTSLTTSCKQKPVEAVPLHRFEQVLFSTPTDQLPDKIANVRNEFSTDLLNLQPDNPDFMNLLIGFTEDPVMRDIYRIVDSVFGDMQPEAQQLAAALDKAKSLYPTVRYDKIYTFISGAFDYNMRVGCNSHELIISLDQYILPYTAKYNYFNSPLYLIHQSDRKYLLTDCMAAIARAHIAAPEGEPTLLDYAVAEGKVLYFLEQTLPSTHDTILLRYSGDQLRWMQKNVEQVWGWLIENRMLYSHDYGQYHNLVDEAPKTNAFGEGSAPRTLAYIGWQIVKQYMKKTGISVQQLFEETDAQKILSQSNYRPK